MSDANWMEKTGATPGKLALVAVLGIVLIWVLAGQFQGTANSRSAVAASSSRPRPSPSEITTDRPEKAAPRESPSPAAASEPTIWPELSIDEVVQHDPFVVPSWLPIEDPEPPSVEPASRQVAAALAQAELERKQRNAMVLDTLRQRGAKIVVLTDAGEVAALGDQMVRVGDTIEGFQITDITPQGIELTEIPTR